MSAILTEPPPGITCLAPAGFTLGHRSYIGAPVWTWGGRVTVGNYTSIGPGCTFLCGASQHPTAINRAAVSNFNFELPASAPDVTIGSDVWVGMSATVLGGVTICHGAIVGAGAVVTRDVPAFTVVAGNPARPVRQRFADDVVRALLELAWWDRPAEWVEAHRHLFDDVNTFLAAIGADEHGGTDSE